VSELVVDVNVAASLSGLTGHDALTAEKGYAASAVGPTRTIGPSMCWRRTALRGHLDCSARDTEVEMIRLYGLSDHPTQRVMWRLEELASSTSRSRPGFLRSWARAPADEVKRLHPSGSCPSWSDDGHLLTESLAINLYLAMKYAGDLTPTPRSMGTAFPVTSWVLNEIDKDLQAAHARSAGAGFLAHQPRTGQQDDELRGRIP